MIIDKLLTKYVDDLNLGKQVDISSYLELCPLENRDEFRLLATMAQTFMRNTIPIEADYQSGEVLFLHLEEKRQERLRRSSEPEKFVANFRTSHLNEDEEHKVRRVMDEIMKEAFGEEE